MRWAIVYGDAWRKAKDAGVDVDALPEDEFPHPPEIIDGFGGWYEDFWLLSTDRQIGMGIGPIPHQSILRHVQGWRYDDADMFTDCIRAMDAVYLELASQKPEDRGKQAVNAREAFRTATGGRRKKG